MNLLVCLFFTLFLAISVLIHLIVNDIVRGPYMDEVFHVPQAGRFCNGSLEWDPKITTLPGLYFFTIFNIRLLEGFEFLNIDKTSSCSISNLRAFNVVVASLNFIIIYYILRARKIRLSEPRLALATLTINSLPVLYFFSFLYYTDAISTLFVLLMYLLFLQKKPWLSGVVGLFAVFTRQTNIIWVFWQGLQIALNVYNGRTHPYVKYDFFKYLRAISLENGAGNGLKKRGRKANKWPKKKKDIGEFIVAVFQEGFVHLAVGLGFCAFVYLNKGIVVGDRSAHAATINIPQLYYFAMFIGFFSGPLFLIRWKSVLTCIRYNPKVYFGLLALGFGAVHWNTVVHPYLLADNRHYTFYFWQRFFQRIPIGKYLFVPMNTALFFYIYTTLKHLDTFTLYTTGLCITANIVPQLLLEFRYFIIPFLLLRVNSNAFSVKELLYELLLFTIVNALTIYKFLYSPFTWNHEPGEVQRFMW